MSIVYVVRHGQSTANADSSLFGTCLNETFPLSILGKNQALRAGNLIKKHAENNAHLVYLDPETIEHKCPITMHCSPYARCIETADHVARGIDVKNESRPNLLLAEMNFGDQEGCNVLEFTERPVEQHNMKLAGPLLYAPLRGESFLDVHTRIGLFVQQQKSFEYCPRNVIVTHGGPALMLHYFLIQECPNNSILYIKAGDYWPNGIVRVYRKTELKFNYLGILQEEVSDVLVQ